MGRNVPQLRFPEFTAEWEEKTLGELGTFRKGKLVSSNNVTDSGVPAMMYGDIYVKYNIDFDSVDYRVSEEMAENCVKIHKGDLLFTCSGETDIDIAKCVCYTGSDEVCIGGDILALTPEKDDSLFVAQHQNTYKTAVQKARVSQGHSVVHIYEQQLSALPIHLPCKEEQEKISQFLSKYDKLIRNQEEKISALKERKQGLLKKIFTQQVRFKDQDGNDYPAWEEKKLGDVCDIVGGGTPATDNNEYWEGNIQWFTPTEIGHSKYASKSERTITELGLNKSSAKLLPKGAILLTTRATLGEMSIAENECCTNQGFQSLIVKDGNITEYVYYLQHIIKAFCLKYASGSTFLEISKNQLAKCKIPYMCIEEQKKIASFFSSFDKKIEIEQEILNNMQEFKKGLLQKMFI